MITIYKSIAEMEAAVAAANSADTEAERVKALCDFALDPVEFGLRDIDPFSREYRSQVLRLYTNISGRTEYAPKVNELTHYLSDESERLPIYYSAGTTSYAGTMLAAMGSILQTMNLKRGQRLLEYGSGEGGISLEAAKCGVDVTVVDIERRFLNIVRKRAEAAGVHIETILGEFGFEAPGQFDTILFFEAFHHCLDHVEMASAIKKMIKPGGRLILSGEPVIGPHNEHWRPAVPYAWGLRMDGVSYRSIKNYGWMELGFDHGYLMEALGRAGYSCEFTQSRATEMANCYVATPIS